MRYVTLRPVAPFRASMHHRLSVSLPTIAALIIAIWYLPTVFVEIPRGFLGHQLVVPAVGQAQWRQGGLDGIDVHALAAFDTLMLAGTSEGIYRSLNDGLDWLPSRFGLPIPDRGRRTLALLRVAESFFQAGTDGAGVWTGSVRAESWVITHFALPTLREKVMSLAANDRMLFAGTDGNGVFRQSRDQRKGEPMWRPSGLSGQKVAAMATSGDRVFAGTLDNGLWVSTNDGASWSKSGRGLPADARIHTLVSPGKTLFAGTSTGLWRSLDNGDKWAEIKLGAAADTAVNAVAADGTNIFVGTGGNGVLVSTDDGKTWKAFNEGLTNRHILALVNHGEKLFAGTKGGGIFMTPLVADANLPPSAKSQTVTLDEDTSTPIRIMGEDPEDRPVTFKILSRPQKGSLTGDAPDLRYTPSANFFGTDSFTFITHDGKSSSRIAVVTINVKPVDDPLELTISGDNSSVIGRLVVLSVQGLDPDGGAVKVSAKSLPRGAVFEHPNGPSLGLAKWVPTAEGTQTFIFTVTQDNGASLTKEFKVNVTSPRPANGWSQVSLFTDKYAREILLDAATIYVVAEGVGSDRSPALLRSTDNGRHWARIGAGLVSRHLYELINSGKALFAATSESIFRSTDGGLNWANVSGGKGLPEGGKRLFVAALGDKALAWSSHKVFLSRDAGGSWSDVTGNLPIGSPGAPSLDSRLISTATVSGDALLVSLYSNPATPNGPFTFRSTNDGANWQAANSGLEGPLSINKFVADKDILYSLTAFHTHHSGDHGARWRVLNPLFSNGRIGVFPNINAAARNGLLVILYSDGSISITRDNGANWTGIDRIIGEDIKALAVGNSSLFAVTQNGKLFNCPIN